MSSSHGGEELVAGDARASRSERTDDVKGKHDQHVPRVLWRQRRQELEETKNARHVSDPLHVSDRREVVGDLTSHVDGRGRGYGKRGGPAAAREVAGVMRTTAELERCSPRNLRRMGLPTAEEYFARRETHEEQKRSLDALLRDASTPIDDKHHATAVFHTTYGRAYNNCPRCWLLRGCCICHLLTTSPIHPHRVVVYMHHTEWWGGGGGVARIPRRHSTRCMLRFTAVSPHRVNEECSS